MYLTEQEIIESAIADAKRMRSRVAREFTSTEKYRRMNPASSFFMAGSPGAGKTELSKELAKLSIEEGSPIMRIDPDEFRGLFKYYTGGNSHLFQRAIVPIIEAIVDKALRRSQDFILDGTLSKYDVAHKNITRCLSKGRRIYIIFVLQDPLISWEFVRLREEEEGRRILPEIFVEQFFTSRDTVNSLKAEFGDAVQLNFVVKHYSNHYGKTLFDVDRVDDAIFDAYNAPALLEAIK